MSSQEEFRNSANPNTAYAIVETSRAYTIPAEETWVGLNYCEPITSIRFDPPLREGAEVMLDVNGEIVPMNFLFSLPGAVKPRSNPARILCEMNPELENRFIDTPALDKLSVRVTGAGALPHNQRLIAEGLNVRVSRGEEHVDMFSYHGVYH